MIGVPAMINQQNERVFIKEDGDLFQLIERLTDEWPPDEAGDIEGDVEPAIQIELSFSVLLDVIDRLPVDKAVLLHYRLEERLGKTTI
jgi:hypothetical protein